MTEHITVQVNVSAPRERVWHDWNDVESMKTWSHASADWHTTHAENDIRVGGSFLMRMEAKGGSAGFDFTGTYTEVVPYERIAYTMEDGRNVIITFEESEEGVRVTETFDPETENPLEMQKTGWQAILNNFKAYAETTRA